MPMGWWTISTRGIVAVAAAGLAIAGCTAGPADLMQPASQRAAGSASPSPGPTGSASTASMRMAPLTGLPATAQSAGRAAVALALSSAHPQGLAAADVVFEEMSSPLRYIAVFQSHDDSSAGPVGQTRPTDAQALSVLHPVIAYDGGTPSFIRVLDKSRVVDVGYTSHPALYHAYAHGVTVSTAQIRQAARDTAPPQSFTYQGSGVGGEAAFASTGAWRMSSLRISAPGQPTQTWSFDSRTGRWRETGGGPSVQAANIVVQTTSYKTVYLSRRYGLRTTSARVIGSGPALMLSCTGRSVAGGPSGVAVKGTWSKPGIRSVTNYLDSSGTPVGFQRGTTWVILSPPGTKISTAGSRS